MIDEIKLERMKIACEDMAYLKSGKYAAKDSLEDIKELEARTINAKMPPLEKPLYAGIKNVR